MRQEEKTKDDETSNQIGEEALELSTHLIYRTGNPARCMSKRGLNSGCNFGKT